MLNNKIDNCVICLEDEHISHGDNIFPIDNINELEKICICNYSVHKKCIQEWLVKNPRCIMCEDPLYYIESNLRIPLPTGIPIYTNETQTDYMDGDHMDDIQIQSSGCYLCIITTSVIIISLVLIYTCS